jgi:uncharacterized delta-60 repeat protein
LIAGRRFTLSSLVAVVALAIALPASALAAAGDPDTSFSGDGQLTTGFGNTPFHPADSGNAAARLSTGEVYVAGTSPGPNGDSDFALVRFTAGGVLDTSFGGGDGIVITDISGAGSDDQAFAVSVDTGTGNVVVAGETGNNETADFALVRYTSSGALDPGFGGDGIVTTDFPAAVEDVALAVTTLAAGGVIAAGFTDTNPDGDIETNDFALAAYTSGGALDPNFDGDSGNGNGRVTTDFGSDDDLANAALLTTAGSKIVVAGSTDPAGDDRGDFALARYSATTGVLDAGFDTDGRQTVSVSSNPAPPSNSNGDAAYGLATDSSSRILVTGFAGPSNGDCAVARLDGTTGALDNTFSTDGKQVVSTPSSPPTINTQDSCTSVLVQADGKIVLAGNEGSANGRFLLMRLDGTTGTPDSSFDTDGIVITDFGGDLFAGGVAVFVDEAASKIIAAGTGNDNFAAARYGMSNGALDGTYGVGGKAEADVPHPVQSSEGARGVAVQPDGKIVVVGPTNVDTITQVGGDQQFGVARYNPDGTLDAGFGAGGIDGNGRVSTNFALMPSGAGTVDSPAAVALQSDGKIIVVGKTDPIDSDPGDFLVARYESDGDLDSTFGGGDGLVTTDFGGGVGGSGGDYANAIALKGTAGSPSFRIVVAGAKSGATQVTEDFAVAVYGENGTPDPGFDTDGLQTIDFGVGDTARAVAVQADGGIVIGGGSSNSVDNNFALARYLTTGAPDPSFGGGDGKVTTDFDAGSFDDGYALALKELGGGQVRIILGGATGFGGTGKGALAAYATDGSLDPSFAAGGTDGDGKASITLSSASNLNRINGLAIQSDGKIVGSGSVESPDFGLIRLTSAGALDPSFGGDGLVSTAFPNPNFEQRSAFGVALLPDGRIVAAGGPFTPFNGSDFLVARYGDPPPSSSPPAQQAPTTPTTPKKKKCKKKKKHRAVAAKKCKRKK